jgi:hypothetical protein
MKRSRSSAIAGITLLLIGVVLTLLPHGTSSAVTVAAPDPINVSGGGSWGMYKELRRARDVPRASEPP